MLAKSNANIYRLTCLSENCWITDVEDLLNQETTFVFAGFVTNLMKVISTELADFDRHDECTDLN